MTTLKIPDLAGKVFLVTGASTGIGAGVAIALAAQGARVGIHFNASESAATEVAAAIADAGGESFLVGGNMADHDQAVSVVDRTAAHFGRLDGLINNAGSMLGRVPTLDSNADHDRAVVDLNSHSVIWASRAAHPWLKKQGGVIINVTSIAARNGGGGGAVLYAAAKGFVSTFTRGFAKEVVGDRIRVNAVSPGVILTPFHERFSTEAQMQGMVSAVPMGRAGTVEDCVGTFLFLASDALSGYVTGQIIEVNGGQLMP
ncbi:SDR family NAD(P)-dependent oxidoreductase [Lichenifustis flavocetrariae]|uniref:SDR family oxidoreductase n=1 Tax=Lichenifustis flavocetrariae TaxID=2949735 RepID=A0AA41Z142_9HYPH|nr:SDR family oxidoreductase [Lichenifustis flavocetrariae]MCW6511032.1 SDR family oxidoreductase [Lichenifustis flavocetrariae]